MISVVMPAHNEEGYLEPAVKAVVAGLGDSGREFEVIIVENGSADGTTEESRRMAAAHPQVMAVSLPTPDYGRALREGFLKARGEIVVNFDVDLVDLDFLERAVAVMEGGDAAVVVGSKRSPGAEDHRPPARRLVTATFSFVLRHGFGLRISDTHGLKALRRAPLINLVERCQFGKDIFDTELIIRAERAGLVVDESPSPSPTPARPARRSPSGSRGR